MSPEVLKGEPYGFQLDIWSVGCLLYELCTYTSAFDAKGYNSVDKIINKDPPELPVSYSKLNVFYKRYFHIIYP